MPTITATVDQVRTLKSGITDDRAWALLGVDAGGQTYTTFDAAWKEKIGQTVEIEYTVEPKGKFTNYRIVDPKPQKKGGLDAQRLTEIRDALREIVALLEARS